MFHLREEGKQLHPDGAISRQPKGDLQLILTCKSLVILNRASPVLPQPPPAGDMHSGINFISCFGSFDLQLFVGHAYQDKFKH